MAHSVLCFNSTQVTVTRSLYTRRLSFVTICESQLTGEEDPISRPKLNGSDVSVDFSGVHFLVLSCIASIE